MMTDNPLKTFVKKRGINQKQLAEILSAAAGYRIQEPSVSMWATGRRKPTLSIRAMIERATLGAVKLTDWDQ